MDKLSAFLNIFGLLLLMVIFFVKMAFALQIALLAVAAICIIAASVRTLRNTFKKRK